MRKTPDPGPCHLHSAYGKPSIKPSPGRGATRFYIIGMTFDFGQIIERRNTGGEK